MTDNRSPLVSVIIPCFNAAQFILETLNSVYTQAGIHMEVIVVDDGSTDDSAHLVRTNYPQAQLIQTANQGPSHARNCGTAAARGDFIQYLDADDWLAPGKVVCQVEALLQHDADVAYGNWERRVTQEDGAYRTIEWVRRQLNAPVDIHLFVDFWCPLAVYLFRRRIVEQVGGWRENLPVIQDARFALDCALHDGRFVYVPATVAAYRQHHAGSVSTRSQRAFLQDCLQNAQEVEAWWQAREQLDEARRQALLQVYGHIAHAAFENDRPIFVQAYAALERLQPGYRPSSPWHLAMLSRLLGYRRAEKVAVQWRRLKAL